VDVVEFERMGGKKAFLPSSGQVNGVVLVRASVCK
jgi:hypothetical protein